ncbi:hypothetical protein A2833_00520 [Candidatus Azambacteria bacterium RIFCSPHIGHO2_01_FULL_44_55]|uniref:Solute-binding protein family 5 domain-containing protein n=1 Tax=Candidatus Azambacteria bacterium RIFCSPLOWO2_02_FULL_44_14 TaxID=1797306 RepID=A0A1F5CCG7_9BACT|nr:MAG: hypothetical protein A3A18_03005 [Candidatus Azambacteria bacterium RIFCSPLOWO2_01_FULL_44_84]OGD32897.1 MAG: hypothetical protein A3C78_01035 [Candidatus Azambacteria bacterium RIFCSPHIGHO2_02_FULL_45_18]OGD40552.1 MAG: hypothetical protein A3I30_01890 [Candidatus Azambacteria bacterium RIFCSPLOWO2_02_FULL_44_14]OGD41553.1 MAG: hypothetical protein A2833_00520 [Candidatus Azambacteria bacterium RIFCSPHIGHO2_01_FULL_44_55]
MLKNLFNAARLLKSPKSWKRIGRALQPKERIGAVILVIVIFISLIWLANQAYVRATESRPALGDTYVEGVMGSPRLLNPILTTTDSDRDVSRLLFSTLLKYDYQGKLVGDLAENFSVSKDGKTYKITLRKNVFWHDGEPLTIDDVLFTIKAVANPDYASPLRATWQGVAVEASEENELTIKLKTPYANFIENLVFLGILPRHIWTSIQPKNFALADFNLTPIGSGPYRFVKLQKDRLGRIVSLTLESNPTYFNNAPFINNLILKSYDSEEEAVSAFNRKEIDGILPATGQNKNQLRGLASSQVFSLASPRIYAIFFNTDDTILKDINVRIALNYAVNREALVSKVLNNEGKIALGPIPPGLLGSSPDITGYDYNPEKAREILDKYGWTKDENGMRAKKLGKDKNPTNLAIDILATPNTQLVATLIKDDLKNIGVGANLTILGLGEIQQNYLKTRQYQAILIGEAYTGTPDPYSFWHSLARKDPGLNLSLYSNRKVDKLIEDARQSTDEVMRAAKYVEFQKLVIADAPAIFLYSPNYLYIVNRKVNGVAIKNLVMPSDRFSEINQWFISTQRVWK